IAEVRVRERHVIRPRRHRRLVLEPRDAGDGDAMMLVVVGEEGEHAVRMHHLGAENGAVPAHQLVEPGRSPHDMGELVRLHDATVGGHPCFPLLLRVHGVLRKSPYSSNVRITITNASQVHAALVSIPWLRSASALTSKRWLPAPSTRKSASSG